MTKPMWRGFAQDMAAALTASDIAPDLDQLTVTGDGELGGWYPVADLAAASIGVAGLALSCATGAAEVAVDRRLAALWFGFSLRSEGWSPPPPWNPVSGDYPTRDGWLRIHANVAAHRAAALRVLFGGVESVPEDKAAVAAAVAEWEASALETQIVEAGGAAAMMRSSHDWRVSPPGAAVAAEPLIHWRRVGAAAPVSADDVLDPSRLLAGVRVLDMTRVLAGPAATRFLAGFGADVLRIDPPDWDEPEIVPEMTLGKRCAGLDLRRAEDRETLLALAADADLVVHGYRPGALSGLGCDPETLRARSPSLIDIGLDAYGWTGPWAGRRGFDSLVQMSSGIAHAGMMRAGADRPTPLPVQALDHATGYLAAAAALMALAARRRAGTVMSARLSLARTAAMLTPSVRSEALPATITERAADLDPWREETAWGAARRLRFPLTRDSVSPRWRRPAGPLRADAPNWGARIDDER